MLYLDSDKESYWWADELDAISPGLLDSELAAAIVTGQLAE